MTFIKTHKLLELSQDCAVVTIFQVQDVFKTKSNPQSINSTVFSPSGPG